MCIKDNNVKASSVPLACLRFAMIGEYTADVLLEKLQQYYLNKHDILNRPFSYIITPRSRRAGEHVQVHGSQQSTH